MRANLRGWQARSFQAGCGRSVPFLRSSRLATFMHRKSPKASDERGPAPFATMQGARGSRPGRSLTRPVELQKK
jgi:hypothetical protein